MRPYQGKERQVRWRVAPEVYGFGWLDLGDLVRPRENVCVYATTFVRAKSGEGRSASLWTGASGAFKLFWNGAEALTDLAYRSLDADRFGVQVTLAKGWNRLTAKVCGDSDPPMLSVRLADAKGAPDGALEFTADPSVSADAAKNAATAEEVRPGREEARGSGAGVRGAGRGQEAESARARGLRSLLAAHRR